MAYRIDRDNADLMAQVVTAARFGRPAIDLRKVSTRLLDDEADPKPVYAPIQPDYDDPTGDDVLTALRCLTGERLAKLGQVVGGALESMASSSDRDMRDSWAAILEAMGVCK